MKKYLSLFGFIIGIAGLTSGILFWILFIPLGDNCPRFFSSFVEFYLKDTAKFFWFYLPIIGLPMSYLGKKGLIRSVGFILCLSSLVLFILAQLNTHTTC